MVQHKFLADAELHEPKGVASASVNTAYLANGLGSGTWGNVVPSNTVIVNSLSDFPAPSGGVITLLANTNYILGADISTSDRFEIGDKCCVTGFNYLAPTLTYTGSGTMFTGTDTGFLIKNISLDCPNAEVFNITDTVGNVLQFEAAGVIVTSCAKWGTFDNLRAVLMQNSSAQSAADGITMIGSSSSVLSVRQFALLSSNSAFTGIDFGTSVQSTVEIRDGFFIGPAGATGLSGLTGSGNIATDLVASVSSTTFAGGLTPLSGISVDDIRWDFEGNSGVQDTMPDAMLSMIGNATNTVISTINTPVKAAGTFVIERASQFTGNTNGRITYDGERNLVTPIDIVATVDVASGTNQDIAVYVAVNGSVITNSRKVIRVDSGSPEAISTIWQRQLSQNDYIELFVENRTSTNDILVTNAVIRVR